MNKKHIQAGVKVVFDTDLVDQFIQETRSHEPSVKQYQSNVLAMKDNIGIIGNVGHSTAVVRYEQMDLTIPVKYLIPLK